MERPFVFATVPDIRAAVAAARAQGKRIGFVPTMGALHAGHAALLHAARSECGFVVASIFVNPAQFGPNEDLQTYPRTFAADRDLCRIAGVDAIFAPDANLVYPPDFRTAVEVRELQDVLCGPIRPGHFRGVCTVVLKLFNVVQPDAAYFGQKDAQQAVILCRMVEDLALPIAMHVLPTVREADGLALSSRNRFLTAAQRQTAPALYQALLQIQQQIVAGERDTALLEGRLRRALTALPDARVDYASIVHATALTAVQPLRDRVLVAAAVRLGNTRLIDNILVDVPAPG